MQRITSGDRWRVRRAVGLLVFQVGMVGVARWHDDRFLSWAPHDEWTDFVRLSAPTPSPLQDEGASCNQPISVLLRDQPISVFGSAVTVPPSEGEPIEASHWAGSASSSVEKNGIGS